MNEKTKDYVIKTEWKTNDRSTRLTKLPVVSFICDVDVTVV